MFSSNLINLNRHSALNRHAAAMLKSVAITKNVNVDVASILKKNGVIENVSNSEADIVDTVEISDTPKKAYALSEEMADFEDIVSFVRRMAQERRGRIGNPNIPAEVVWSFLNSDPHKEEIEQAHVLGAEAVKIRAKMQRGELPNNEEMDFLKEHFPELYMSAKRIEQEMNQLRKQLKNCDTREEKSKVILQKMSQLAGIAKKDPGHAQFMLAAILKDLDELLSESGHRRGESMVMEDDVPAAPPPNKPDESHQEVQLRRV